MKRLLLAIEPTTRLHKSWELLQQLQSSEAYRSSQSLCIYLSLPDEPYTGTIIESALASGRRVFVPRLLPSDVAHEKFPLTRHLGHMRMHAIHSLGSWNEWPLNKFGIREPPISHSVVDLDDALSYNVDMLILPGLAFTKDGKRLGRGGGYYDRYLAGMRAIFTERARSRMPFLLALAFKEQVLPELPTCPHDFIVDKVLYS
uniref:5-formyltetrahydrofolate cyclo-ligase n=1 Tax=Schistocephalus solidus TaxID=70667 RepID=A0A0V0J802_SCHSO